MSDMTDMMSICPIIFGTQAPLVKPRCWSPWNILPDLHRGVTGSICTITRQSTQGCFYNLFTDLVSFFRRSSPRHVLEPWVHDCCKFECFTCFVKVAVHSVNLWSELCPILSNTWDQLFFLRGSRPNGSWCASSNCSNFNACLIRSPFQKYWVAKTRKMCNVAKRAKLLSAQN